MLQGDYNQYECGLTVANARAEDDGEWKCDFESYVKVGEDFFGYFEEEVSSLFRIFQLSSLLRVERGVVDTKLLKHSKLLLSSQLQPPLQPPQLQPPQPPLQPPQPPLQPLQQLQKKGSLKP